MWWNEIERKYHLKSIPTVKQDFWIRKSFYMCSFLNNVTAIIFWMAP